MNTTKGNQECATTTAVSPNIDPVTVGGNVQGRESDGASGVIANGGGKKQEWGQRVRPPGWRTAVFAVFAVSGIFHEAVVYVAMRGTCWPFNTFLLTVAAVFILTWDAVFPVVDQRGEQSITASSPATAAVAGVPVSLPGARGEGGGVGVGPSVDAFGARGPTAPFVFTILVQISGLIADFAAWLWWREVFLKQE